jgi:hypothetical protein
MKGFKPTFYTGKNHETLLANYDGDAAWFGFAHGCFGSTKANCTWSRTRSSATFAATESQPGNPDGSAKSSAAEAWHSAARSG